MAGFIADEAAACHWRYCAKLWSAAARRRFVFSKPTGHRKTKRRRALHSESGYYRQGLMLERANKLPEARAKWERVIREFPRNDEASLACAKLNRPNCR
jgi:hypothetical protein